MRDKLPGWRRRQARHPADWWPADKLMNPGAVSRGKLPVARVFQVSRAKETRTVADIDE